MTNYVGPILFLLRKLLNNVKPQHKLYWRILFVWLVLKIRVVSYYNHFFLWVTITSFFFHWLLDG